VVLEATTTAEAANVRKDERPEAMERVPGKKREAKAEPTFPARRLGTQAGPCGLRQGG
jgi:hypothetical protein